MAPTIRRSTIPLMRSAERWACLSHSLVVFHRLILHENPGHAFIDLLKIDIEGAEFDTLTAFLAAHKPLSPFSSTTLLIGQLPRSGRPFWPKAILAYVNYNPGGKPNLAEWLQLKIRAREGHENFEYFARWWAALEAAGLRPFWTEPNLVYINLVRGVRPEPAEYSFINIRGNHALVNEAFN
ncbi:hypothetical protein EDB92DRAFT_1948242 [Lactarius akahatsu]|uniref:Methyltransferase FkbM domain-containing protein n=1 Tax=Lactarius akahatsu TaxID=416441 RepID=A0AAD4LBT2_9AGAM|nr:hypothetical protein EDB92DRAFT_1948242 [Lactarius akahatsu]